MSFPKKDWDSLTQQVARTAPPTPPSLLQKKHSLEEDEEEDNDNDKDKDKLTQRVGPTPPSLLFRRNIHFAYNYPLSLSL